MNLNKVSLFERKETKDKSVEHAFKMMFIVPQRDELIWMPSSQYSFFASHYYFLASEYYFFSSHYYFLAPQNYFFTA